MEEVYYSSRSALLLLLVLIVGLVMGVLRGKPKWAKSDNLLEYFMGSATLFCMAIPLATYIHRENANKELRGLSSSLPYIGLACYALVIICVGFLKLRNTTKIRRWIIFPIIALGIVTWLGLDVREDNPLKWGIVAYFVPQLLLFFAKKHEDDQHLSPEQATIVGSNQSSQT